MDGIHPAGSAPPRGRIICQRADGLGGRLLTLLWTLRLARKVDASVLMFWPKLELFYDNVTAAGDIFDLYRLASPPFRDRLQIVDGECRRFLRPNEVMLEKGKAHDPRAFVTPVDADPWKHPLPVIVGHWDGPLLMAEEVEREVLAEIPSIFAELPIRRDLKRAVNTIAKAHGLHKMVAVHIRRGEIVRNLRVAIAGCRRDEPESHELLKDRAGTFARRCMSLENFADRLHRFVDEGRTILVFSDEPGIHQELARLLDTPNVIPVASLVTGEFTAMQQAFIEACLMSRCSCIVGARSAYGRLANVIGGNRRISMAKRSRTVEDCAALAFESVSEALLSHSDKALVEQLIHDGIVRMWEP